MGDAVWLSRMDISGFPSCSLELEVFTLHCVLAAAEWRFQKRFCHTHKMGPVGGNGWLGWGRSAFHYTYAHHVAQLK